MNRQEKLENFINYNPNEDLDRCLVYRWRLDSQQDPFLTFVIPSIEPFSGTASVKQSIVSTPQLQTGCAFLW